MHSILIAIIRMGHPHSSIKNVLNFLWCLWKARNDFLFDRKNHLPYQVNIAAAALDYEPLVDPSCPPTKKPHFNDVQETHVLPLQGKTLKSDLLVPGTKIFSDAAFRSTKIPGLAQGQVGTGIGVLFPYLRIRASLMFRFRLRPLLPLLLCRLKLWLSPVLHI